MKIFRRIKFKINPKTKKLIINDNRDLDEYDIERGFFKEINLEIDEIYEENYFGDYEIINNQKSQVTVIVYTPCQLIILPKVDFTVMIPQQIQFLQKKSKSYSPDEILRKIYLEGLSWRIYRKNTLLSIENYIKNKNK